MENFCTDRENSDIFLGAEAMQNGGKQPAAMSMGGGGITNAGIPIQCTEMGSAIAQSDYQTRQAYRLMTRDDSIEN